MGCDIHMFVEVRKRKDPKPAQEHIEHEWVDGDLYDSNGKMVELHGDRNYSLFGILAGVRREANVIDDPRGIPPDCTDRVKKKREDWDVDGHSASYFTLAELQEYRATKSNGFVTSSTTTVNWSAENWNPIDTLIQKLKWRASDLTIWKPEDIRIVFWFDN